MDPGPDYSRCNSAFVWPDQSVFGRVALPCLNHKGGERVPFWEKSLGPIIRRGM
jgi:hypothetical protein